MDRNRDMERRIMTAHSMNATDKIILLHVIARVKGPEVTYMPQTKIARELHLGYSTIQRSFARFKSLGIISTRSGRIRVHFSHPLFTGEAREWSMADRREMESAWEPKHADPLDALLGKEFKHLKKVIQGMVAAWHGVNACQSYDI